MNTCKSCGSTMVWIGSISSGHLGCVDCEAEAHVGCSGCARDYGQNSAVSTDHEWATEVKGDWVEDAAENIERLNKERGFAGENDIFGSEQIIEIKTRSDSDPYVQPKPEDWWDKDDIS